jgi:hypothetical protein
MQASKESVMAARIDASKQSSKGASKQSSKKGWKHTCKKAWMDAYSHPARTGVCVTASMSVCLNACTAWNRSESVLACMVAALLPCITVLISKIACTHATKNEWVSAGIYAAIASGMLALSIHECTDAFIHLLKDDPEHAWYRACIFDVCMVAFEIAHMRATKKASK